MTQALLTWSSQSTGGEGGGAGRQPLYQRGNATTQVYTECCGNEGYVVNN